MLAIFLASAGHGWTTPLLVSIPLWVLFPLTLYSFRQDVPHSRAILLTLAVIALGSDAILVKGSIAEAGYAAAMIRLNGIIGLLIAAAWCALWLAWHVILVRALATRADGADA